MPFLKKEFTDIFVGGGSVICHIAKLFPKLKINANDLDFNMYCFWNLVARGRDHELKELFRLLGQRPTIELFESLRSSKSENEVKCAYKAIFFNRTTFSGISTCGPIGGFAQKSKWKIDCRYNFVKMKTKIIEMKELFAGRLTVTNFDFERALVDSIMYLDPPYYKKGNELYKHKMSHSDHVRLSNKLREHKLWLLSYDNCEEVTSLYSGYDAQAMKKRYSISGKKKEWAEKSELLIFSEGLKQ